MADIERPNQTSARTTRNYPVDRKEFLAAARRAADRLPRWTVRDAGEEGLNLVHSTRIFRFKDDVTVRTFREDVTTRSVFESTSRIGKGDFGQNPRNLRELLDALDAELG